MTTTFTYQNLTIIGTSHIAKSSVKQVTDAIAAKPDIVCIELDQARLYAMLHPQEQKLSLATIKHYGVKGFLFALIGQVVQKKMGEMVGVKPGSEMLAAVKLAQKNNIPLFLIDRPLDSTLKRFSQKLSWKERWHFVADIVMAPFSKKIKINLAEVPEDELIKKLMLQLKQRYPNIYTVLVAERNTYMAKKLYKLIQEHPEKKIIAIVGAGHAEDIISLLKKHTFETV
jgi:pheromone shutdown-related protein TraB